MIKKLWNKFKEKLIVFVKWIKNECKDWHTFLLLLIVSIVMFSPVWGGYVLFFVFHWNWAAWVATTTFALLIGPIPFWVLSIAITLAIKRLFEKKQKHDNDLAKENAKSEAENEIAEEPSSEQEADNQ